MPHEAHELDGDENILLDPSGAGDTSGHYPPPVGGKTTVHLIDPDHPPRQRVVICRRKEIGANAMLTVAGEVEPGIEVCQSCFEGR